MNLFPELNPYDFGDYSILVRNEVFVKNNLHLDCELTFLKIEEKILSTIGYTSEGIDRLIGRMQKLDKITHLSVLCEGNREDYEPYIVFDCDVKKKQLSERLSSLFSQWIAASAESSQVVQGLFLSFSKIYSTTIEEKTRDYPFVAHASPIIFAKVSSRYALFAFDLTAERLCNTPVLQEFMRANSVSLFSLEEPLLYSESNCCAFTFDIMNKCLNDFELIDFMFEKNLSSDVCHSIPLEPERLPPILMQCCESVSRKRQYLAAMKEADACAEKILMGAIRSGSLVKLREGHHIEQEKKSISTYLHQLNMDQARFLNRGNHEMKTLLEEELNVLEPIQNLCTSGSS